MVYRDGIQGEPCLVCDSRTEQRCTACRRPWCRDHVDARSHCRLCAESYDRHRRANREYDFGSLSAGGIGAVIASMVFGLTLPLTIGVAAVAGPSVLIANRIRRHRAFLRGRRIRVPGVAALPVGELDERALTAYTDANDYSRQQKSDS